MLLSGQQRTAGGINRILSETFVVSCFSMKWLYVYVGPLFDAVVGEFLMECDNTFAFEESSLHNFDFFFRPIRFIDVGTTENDSEGNLKMNMEVILYFTESLISNFPA